MNVYIIFPEHVVKAIWPVSPHSYITCYVMVKKTLRLVFQWCWGPFAIWAQPHPFLATPPCCLKKPSKPSHTQMCSLNSTHTSLKWQIPPLLFIHAERKTSLPQIHYFPEKFLKGALTFFNLYGCYFYNFRWTVGNSAHRKLFFLTSLAVQK